MYVQNQCTKGPTRFSVQPGANSKRRGQLVGPCLDERSKGVHSRYHFVIGILQYSGHGLWLHLGIFRKSKITITKRYALEVGAYSAPSLYGPLKGNKQTTMWWDFVFLLSFLVWPCLMQLLSYEALPPHQQVSQHQEEVSKCYAPI